MRQCGFAIAIEKMLCTLPSAKRDLLMLEASFSVSLLVFVSFTRSLPACHASQIWHVQFTLVLGIAAAACMWSLRRHSSH